MTHWRSVKLAFRSCSIDGRATFTIVMSTRSMKVAVQTATSVHHLRSMAPDTTDRPAREMGALSSGRWTGGGIDDLGSPPMADDPRADVPEGLWERLRADPVRAPEHLALAAAERHGPAAAAWAADKRRRYGHEGRELASMAKRRHAALARFEGAATGVGGVFTVVPDLVAVTWIQSRLVFFVSPAHGVRPP